MAVEEAAPRVGVRAAASAVGLSRAMIYRCRKPAPPALLRPRPPSPRRLSDAEIDRALGILHEPRFVDLTPWSIHAVLLDEGVYVASVRTFYRILEAHQEVKERRDQLRHQRHAVPRLVATRPNQVWSWDITKLRGPTPGEFFYLYVVLDIYSRYVVGWLIAPRESAELATKLIEETAVRQGVEPGTLTVHADRGAPMRSKLLGRSAAAFTISLSFSRPRVSNDNPYSESQFKTMKYRHDFPECFGCLQDAAAHMTRFFAWYNDEHRHSGIGFLTPADVHLGRSSAVLATRQRALDLAYAAHPERFNRRAPRAPTLPKAAWINQPSDALPVTPAALVAP